MPTFTNPAAQSLYERIVSNPDHFQVAKQAIVRALTFGPQTEEEDGVTQECFLSPDDAISALQEELLSVGIHVVHLDDSALMEIATAIVEELQKLSTPEVLALHGGFYDGAESDSENG